MTTTPIEYIQGIVLEGVNVLDAAFNTPDIWMRSSYGIRSRTASGYAEQVPWSNAAFRTRRKYGSWVDRGQLLNGEF